VFVIVHPVNNLVARFLEFLVIDDEVFFFFSEIIRPRRKLSFKYQILTYRL